MKKRNGNIELMRLVFCVIVILFHCRNAIEIKLPEPFEFFSEGKIGVEFFFLVSGWLLAKNAKKHYVTNNIAVDTQRFLFKKLRSVLPYHVTVYAVCLAVSFALKTEYTAKDSFLSVIDTLPNFFFIQNSGVHKRTLITPEWYVAAMLLMMAIIYPLVLKYRERFTRLACPLIVIFSIGYMIHSQGKLGGVERWVFGGTFPKGYLRAFCEICGGAFCFEVSGFLKRLNFSKADRLFLTAAEVICYVLPIAYTFSNFPNSYEAYAFYSLAIAVTLTFSEVTYFSGKLNNSFIYALGRFSLPLYYAQRLGFIIIGNTALGEMRVRNQLLFCFATTLAFALLLVPVNKLFTKAFNGKVNALRSKKELTV